MCSVGSFADSYLYPCNMSYDTNLKLFTRKYVHHSGNKHKVQMSLIMMFYGYSYLITVFQVKLTMTTFLDQMQEQPSDVSTCPH